MAQPPLFAALLLAATLIAGSALLARPALAQSVINNREPVLVTAGSLSYDQNLGIVTARDNVELAQQGRTLLADTVSYSERDGKVIASGNISIMEDDGTVLFAEYVELTDGMRNGFIRDIGILLSDNSRVAAASATRTGNNKTTMNKAVYTSCTLCAADPTRPPLWQLKGERVEHDEAAQQITYQDATLEMFGIPVLYTPYFSHPDPTVRRKSGFLSPSASTNNYFGVAVRTPYYYVIDDSADLTLTPQYSTKEGPFLMGEYRQRTAKGELRMDASVTRANLRNANGDRTDDDYFRGHLRADGIFRNSSDLTYGFNFFRASDDTYLSRYQIPDRANNNVLTSRLFAENINNRSFMAANAYSFQGLRPTDVPGLTPFVVPLLDYSYIGQPGAYGGRWAIDSSMAALYRTGGTDSRRLSTTVSWSQPYFAPSGEVYTATALLKTDGYWVNELQDRPYLATNDADARFAGRAIPMLALDWRYPLVRDSGSIRQLVEPIVGVVLAPYGGNPRTIPNEDSLSFEFDETNLFSFNRFPGSDRVDGGPKVNYGLRTAVYGSRGGYSEVLIGQSYRLRNDDTFGPGTGISEQLSDYVARVTISPNEYLTFSDRLRISPNSQSEIQRQEISVGIGPKAMRLTLSYADIANNTFTGDIGEREAVSGILKARLGQYWNFEARHIRDLGERGGSLLNFLGLRYTDECFDVMFFAERTFTVNRDVQPATTFGLRFRLANFN
ncbi:LPS-assembly protein LptD [Ferrovibrio sp.]|uniref:LPS-assembly protein LptD n=1 Tax=Ferrovibrio sp. TaxID=1917215 RepID=UPI003D10C15D